MPLFQLCDKPLIIRDHLYRFSYHFCNRRIGRKLFMDFFYWPQPNDFGGWIMMRYGVDSMICERWVDRPLPR